MKKNLILLVGALIFYIYPPISHAQEKKMNVADFEKRKQEYVMEKAGLTPEEAQRYFPLNNELNQKKFELNRQHREKIEKMLKNREITEEEYRKILENDVEIKLKEAELDKEYADKFDKVLPPEKLYKARQAEKNFIQQEISRFRNENKRDNNTQNRGSQMKNNTNDRRGRNNR